jgi:hypothetical protein
MSIATSLAGLTQDRATTVAIHKIYIETRFATCFAGAQVGQINNLVQRASKTVPTPTLSDIRKKVYKDNGRQEHSRDKRRERAAEDFDNIYKENIASRTRHGPRAMLLSNFDAKNADIDVAS